MERRIDLAEISDGKLYGAEDMVKADCGDCEGCSACCQGMGDSILLDPYDICRLSEGLGKSFEELMKEAVGLKMADGLILPYLKMTGEKEACSFLNSEGRCSIHSGQASAVSFLWAVFMKTEASGIFSRSMSAGRKIGQRYGYANGWIRLILRPMSSLSVTGTT